MNEVYQKLANTTRVKAAEVAGATVVASEVVPTEVLETTPVELTVDELIEHIARPSITEAPRLAPGRSV